MSTSLRSFVNFSTTQLIDHVRIPLYRNGYALVLSSAITSGLGLLYWTLAARNYPAEIVGLNSVAIETMIFLASMSQLNLQNTLNRFIPRAGKVTGRLVVSAYLISAIVALLLGLIFVFGTDLWAPSLNFLKSNPYFILWFTLATMAWCIFVLQDSTLTGLGQAIWVPLENLIFAVAKIVLLVVFTTSLTKFGILASWTIPVLFLLFPVNVLILGRLVPQHIRVTQAKAEPFAVSQVASYAASDYLATMIWMGTIRLLPLLVLEQVGATTTAYFYLSWIIAYSLYLVSINMGMSLVTEASADQTKLNAYSYRVLVQTARLLIPVVIVLGFGAPYLLRLFGRSYAAEGVTLLRLLCLSAIPNIVTSIYISTLRVQRHMKAVVIVLFSLCGLVLGLSYILLNIFGITGIGLAWLLSQTVVATFVVMTQFRKAWQPYLNLQGVLRILATPRRWWWQWKLRHHLARAQGLLPDILLTVPLPAKTLPPTHWQIQKVVHTVSDMTVMTLGAKNYPPVALLKLPQTGRALVSLQQQCAVLATLQADTRLGDWRALLPSVLTHGEIAGQAYSIEQMLPGQEAKILLSDPRRSQQVQTAAAAAIEVLHQRTASPVIIEAELLDHWIDEPLNLIGQITKNERNGQVLERLKAELYAALAGRTVAVSWVHGDFAPGNILTTADAYRVTGFIDWELANPNALPQLDLVHLFLSTRMITERCELGDVVRAFLTGETWTSHEYNLLNTAQVSLPGEALEPRTLILLTWLRHIANMLSKSTRYDSHWLWLAKNVEGVLQCL